MIKYYNKRLKETQDIKECLYLFFSEDDYNCVIQLLKYYGLSTDGIFTNPGLYYWNSEKKSWVFKW